MGGKHLFSSKSDPGKIQHLKSTRLARYKGRPHLRVKSTGKGQKENLSFCGCGFLGIYHVGVASCFHEYAPQLSKQKISGASAGALVATAYICGNLPLARSLTDFMEIAREAGARSLGPIHPSFDITSTVRDALVRGLPDDVHKRVNGKLHISLTRAYDWKNVIVSKFDSKEDVIQALLCSCFIPYWSGFESPQYKGVAYIDGGLSNNLLVLDDKTITVSPFAGEADICPQDEVSSLYTVNFSNTSFSVTPHNLYRISRALLPPPTGVLSDLFKQGFADGIRFLQRMNLISCTKCLEIRSNIIVTHETEIIEQTYARIGGDRRNGSSLSLVEDQQVHFEPYYLSEGALDLIPVGDDCDGCMLRSMNALGDPLPSQFSDILREACENVNRSLSNWIYSHRPIKYLSYMAAPYYLPLNISLALLSKYWQHLPNIGSDIVKTIFENFKEIFIETLKRFLERSTTSMLMSPSSLWRDKVDITTKQQSNSASSISVQITADCRRSTIKSSTTYDFSFTVSLFERGLIANISKCM